MAKTKPRTTKTPRESGLVGHMEGKTLVIDLHAAGQGPHWLSGQRKPANASLHIGAIPDDVEGRVDAASKLYTAITGKTMTQAGIDKAREKFTKIEAARLKPGVSTRQLVRR